MTEVIDQKVRDPVTNRDEVLQRLRDHEADIRRFYAESLYLFGSAARDELRPDSDVDVFIDYDMESPFSFVELIRAGEYIKTLLGRPVDFGTRDGLHPKLRHEIEDTAIRVF